MAHFIHNFFRVLLYPIKIFTLPYRHFRDHPQGFWQLVATLQGLTIVALAGFLYYSHYYKDAMATPELSIPELPRIPVEAGPVEVGSFESYIHIEGVLKANDSVILRPEIDGKVKEIYFTTGQKVNAGDKILRLEDDLYRANLQEAEAKLMLSKSRYERALALLERQAGTVKDKDQTFAEWKIAEAEVEKARAQLKKTLIVAPFEGVVGLKNLSKGTYVKPGEEIVTLNDIDPIKVEFNISEIYMDKIQVGKEVSLEVEGFPDYNFKATIDGIDTNVDPQNHSIKVQGSFANFNNELRPGLFARIKLLTSIHENAVMVPDSAVESRGNQEFVYTVKDGVAVYTPVKTGGRNGDKVEIQAGLDLKDIVIVAGQLKIQDKFPVLVLPPHQSAGQ